VGANYLEVCRKAASTDAHVDRALSGIHAVLDGSLPLFEIEYPCHSPWEQRWFLMTVAPLSRGSGGAIISHSNITTRILAEQALRMSNEEALASARRLEAAGRLAGGVAHDFNNLLAVIAGNLELAEDGDADEPTRELMRRARDAAEKGRDLNTRLLSLARKRALAPQYLSVNWRVEETAKLLTSALGEHITVGMELAADLWMTLADPGEIDSALLNTAANARDAMPKGGRIAIATSNVTFDAPSAAALHTDALPGEYVRLTIADDGAGMPREILEKAMEPFFTTKGPAGSGFGLASVASFAKKTGGFATIASALGQGCIVSLYLPRCMKEPLARGISASVASLGDGLLVLVVEDNDQVREVTLKRLESLGYAVAEARTGPEALERLQSGDPVQIVLSDIVMPGMTGYDVLRWVRSNKPRIKVILCSGYNEGDRGGSDQGAIRDAVILGKPYSRDQLARALSDALALS
jgi:signal transduction histidine kinase